MNANYRNKTNAHPATVTIALYDTVYSNYRIHYNNLGYIVILLYYRYRSSTTTTTSSTTTTSTTASTLYLFTL